jgi:hypothetical protein
MVLFIFNGSVLYIQPDLVIRLSHLINSEDIKRFYNEYSCSKKGVGLALKGIKEAEQGSTLQNI